jgi:MoxR-like ATPase
MKITMGYPSVTEEEQIMQLHQGNLDFVKLSDIEPVITKEELTYLRRNINKVYIDPTLVNYIVNIVQQTRTSKRVLLGASPRASIAMMQSAKAYAVLQGRDFVIPEDVRFVTPSILQHRMIITAEAEMEGFTPLKVTQRLIDKVEVPK